MSDLVLGIKITTDGAKAKAEIASVNGELLKTEQSGKKAAQGLNSIDRAATGAARAAGQLAGIMGGITAAGVVTYIARTAAEFDRLRASLQTVTGSAANAVGAMDMIRRFAAQTPYDLQQVTDAFIRLKSLGLDASENSLRSFGNTASAMGKPLMMFIEAVADASTNEFERLKEFGIKAKQEGDRVTFTFQGISTTVNKTADDITRYLKQIGDTKFAGGMALQMDTLGGKLSNLQDAFSNLADTIASLGPRSMLKETMTGWTAIFSDLQRQIEATFGEGTNSTIAAYEQRIKELRGALMNEDKLREAGLGFLFSDEAYDKKVDQLRLAEEQLKKLNGATEEASVSNAEFKKHLDDLGISAKRVGEDINATRAAVVEMAKLKGVPPALALAVTGSESSYRQSARSDKGAIGLMQLMPDTAKRFNVIAEDAVDNIRGGMTYLAELLKMFQGDIRLAAAAYNAGENAVKRAGRKVGLPGEVPNYPETIEYVDRVTNRYRQFMKEFPGGAPAVDEDYQQKKVEAYRRIYEAGLDKVEAAARASGDRTVADIQLAIKKLETQRAAFKEFTAGAIADATGGQKIATIRLSAAQEEQIIRRLTSLKLQQAAVEQQSAQASVSAINQRLAAEDRNALTQAEVIQLQAKRETAESNLYRMAQERAQIEVEAGAEIVAVHQGAADGVAQESRAMKEAATARDQYLARLEDQIKALQGVNDEVANEADLVKLTTGMAEKDAAAWTTNYKKKLELYNALKKAAEDQKKSEKAVADEQLRMANYYSTMVDQARSAARLIAESFGEAGQSIGAMFVAIAENAQYSYQIQAKLANDLKNATTDDQRQKLQSEAYTKELGAQFQMYGQLTRAASGFFEKGSSGLRPSRARLRPSPSHRWR